VQINAANLRTLGIGYRAEFQRVLGSITPMYTRVATVVPSGTKSNEYGWLNQLPRVREWLGDRVVNNISSSDYAIKNKPWEMTIAVDRDDISDDNVGVYTPLFGEMGRTTATFPDELIFPLLKAGFSTPCYDKQFFFDTDHPVLDANGVAQSVSNTGGGSGTGWYLLDVSRALKPTIFQQRKAFDFVSMDAPTDENVFSKKEFRYGVDGRSNVGFGFWQLAYGSKQTLDGTAYEAARAAMSGLKGDYGRPLGVVPNLLVVPPALEGAGRRLLQSQLVNGGESNPWAGTAELMVVPWLA
jgi:phage major head subunit gpT-like protein